MAYIIKIKGLVQGVGFRPFIYRIATEMGINGTVENQNDGVRILAHITSQRLQHFIGRIKNEAPVIAKIRDIGVTGIPETVPCGDFKIKASNHGMGVTQVSPDMAVCEECLADREKQPNRIDYPFVNCTNCGPRFSIVESLPYDRANTTMSPIKMCDECRVEYENPVNRRFHAQPTGCNNCGVHYGYTISENVRNVDYHSILREMIKRLMKGEVVAIKSVGGYNLMCDVKNEAAVAHIRRLKHRERKPLAVMADCVRTVVSMACVDKDEENALTSWRRPIVILRCKRKNGMMRRVAPMYDTIGVMLPYQPVHYDIFAHSPIKVLVVTSGNIENEPIITDDEVAYSTFAIREGLMTVDYNRAIHNRIDDSILRKIDGKMRVVRRARGYTPEPLAVNADGVMAAGADMVSHFAIGVGGQIIASQYIGAMGGSGNERFYKEAYNNLARLYGFVSQMTVVDAHPQYRSAIIAKELTSVPTVVKVYHHHAHAVAVMTEYGLSGDAIAVILDGTGWGKDHTMWGGEILRCSRKSFDRLWHLPRLVMPGGDKASMEPWRMAVSMVHSVYGKSDRLPYPLIDAVGKDAVTAVTEMLEHNVCIHVSTGAGRLFDAVSALLGVCYYNSYSGEAAILLEQTAQSRCDEAYDVGLENYGQLLTFILNDMDTGVDIATISARFHNGIADALAKECVRRAASCRLENVVLGGGVMQNKILVERLCDGLRRNGLTVYLPAEYPCNDGGIAIGQMGCVL